MGIGTVTTDAWAEDGVWIEGRTYALYFALVLCAERWASGSASRAYGHIIAVWCWPRIWEFKGVAGSGVRRGGGGLLSRFRVCALVGSRLMR